MVSMPDGQVTEAQSLAAEVTKIAIQSEAAKKIGPSRELSQSAIQVLTEDRNLSKLTDFIHRRESQDYSLIEYLDDLLTAVGKIDEDEQYHFPTLKPLLQYDYQRRISVKKGGRKDVVQTTHIVEQHGEARRGWFGRR